MIIAGGGTGGHVFPGIAVAEEFKRRHEKAEVFFIGTEHGIESRVIPKEGYTIRFIQAEGFIGKSPLRKLNALLKMLMSMLRSRQLLKAIRPDIVVGTGGYASIGPVAVACLMSIPTLIMEQNLVPGLANRLLGRLVDAVSVTYHESITFFPMSKTHLTGNPVRGAILRADRPSAYNLFSLDDNRFTILVLGGSSGSKSINNAVVNGLSYLTDLRDSMQFLHQTGEEGYEAVRKAYRRQGFKCTASPFIYQMAEAYAVADLVISRAGATTLAEITAMGKPAILIPYPYAAGHQEFNAKKLHDAGACRMMLEHELSGELLSRNIKEICMSPDIRAEMAKQSLSMGRPNAVAEVVDIASSLINLRQKLGSSRNCHV